MSKDLLNPDIDFFIDIPNSDQIIETSLETLTNTDQKLLEHDSDWRSEFELD